MDKTDGNNHGCCPDSQNEVSVEGRTTMNAKIKESQMRLPIFQMKAELLQAMERNQILIVVGETGSGKTTQIPQYLVEMGLATKKRIACAQLRNVAAIQAAKRVALERGCNVGEEVGFTVKYEDYCVGPTTKIIYMTHEFLLKECERDSLERYSAVVLEEPHERSIKTDLLLG